MSTPEVEQVQIDQLNCWRIRHGQSELLVAQQGAQVLSYQVGEQPPLIWLNPDATLKHGKPVRAGVPVCWPWFGNLLRNPPAVQAMRQASDEASAHGLVRAAEWELLSIEEVEGGVRIALTLDEAAEGHLPGWPHKVRPTLEILSGQYLTISLTSENLDTHPVAISQALHSYFSVSDVRTVQVEEAAGLTYIETLENWKPRTQQGPLGFAGETDRIYVKTPPTLSIADSGHNRRIVLESEGSNSAVIWNPWIDRAAALPDLADDGWQQMLCIETANVLDDHVTLAPGARHTLSVTVRSEAL